MNKSAIYFCEYPLPVNFGIGGVIASYYLAINHIIQGIAIYF
jgi:hypothetical protein